MKSILFSLIVGVLALTQMDALANQSYQPGLCVLPDGGTGAQCTKPTPSGPCSTVQACYAAPVIKQNQ